MYGDGKRPFFFHSASPVAVALSMSVRLHKGSAFPNVMFKLQQRERKINTEWSAEGLHSLGPGYKVKLASW